MLRVFPNASMTECILCFDKFVSDSDGIHCYQPDQHLERKHFLCSQDFNHYLSINALSQLHNVRDNLGLIPCPHDSCKNKFHPVDSFRIMNPDNRLRWIRILEDWVTTYRIPKKTTTEKPVAMMQNIVRRVKMALIDVLTYRCPGCRQAVDPLPDACSAVLCLSCGNFYCNYCFELFESGDADANGRAACHAHVSTHHPADEMKDAFLPSEVIEHGHQSWQRLQVLNCLRLALHSNSMRSQWAQHSIALALLLCSDHMKDLLCPAKMYEMWQSALVGNPAVNENRAPIMYNSSHGFKMMNAVVNGATAAFYQLLADLPEGSQEIDYICPSSGLCLAGMTK